MGICSRDSDLIYLGLVCPPPERNPGYVPVLNSERPNDSFSPDRTVLSQLEAKCYGGVPLWDGK